MKRKILLLLLTISLSGCATMRRDNSESDALSKYESYLNTLVEQDRFTSDSLYYDISAILNKLDDGTVRYDVFIENPSIAMYDIEVLVVESTAKRTDNYIYPCVGIFNNENFIMIPNQSNEENGYVQAFLLSGISKEEQPILNVLVTWKDYAKLQTYREFVKLFPIVEVVESITENEEDLENVED